MAKTLIPFASGAYSSQTSGIAVPTGAYDATDLLRIPEVDEDFHNLNDGTFLLYQLLNVFSKGKACEQPRYEFFEDDVLPVRTTVVGAETDSAGDIELTEQVVSANTNVFIPRTGEIIRVTTIDAGGIATCTRGHRGTTAAALVAGDDVFLLGQDLPEGASANIGISQMPDKDWNAISFYSTGWKVTDIQEFSNMLNETGQLSREQNMQVLKMMREIDADLRWGARNVDTSTSGDGTLYYTDGFNSRISTNEVELSGTLTWHDLNDALLPIFAATSSSMVKQFLMGQSLYSAINRIAYDKVTPAEYNEKLGANISTLELEGGYQLQLVIDKHGFPAGTTTSNWGFVIDSAKAEFIPYTGFDMVIRDVTAIGSHTNQVELFTSASMKLTHEENNAVVKLV